MNEQKDIMYISNKPECASCMIDQTPHGNSYVNPYKSISYTGDICQAKHFEEYPSFFCEIDDGITFNQFQRDVIKLTGSFLSEDKTVNRRNMFQAVNDILSHAHKMSDCMNFWMAQNEPSAEETDSAISAMAESIADILKAAVAFSNCTDYPLGTIALAKLISLSEEQADKKTEEASE